MTHPFWWGTDKPMVSDQSKWPTLVLPVHKPWAVHAAETKPEVKTYRPKGGGKFNTYKGGVMKPLGDYRKSFINMGYQAAECMAAVLPHPTHDIRLVEQTLIMATSIIDRYALALTWPKVTARIDAPVEVELHAVTFIEGNFWIMRLVDALAADLGVSLVYEKTDTWKRSVHAIGRDCAVKVFAMTAKFLYQSVRLMVTNPDPHKIKQALWVKAMAQWHRDNLARRGRWGTEVHRRGRHILEAKNEIDMVRNYVFLETEQYGLHKRLWVTQKDVPETRVDFSLRNAYSKR